MEYSIALVFLFLSLEWSSELQERDGAIAAMMKLTETTLNTLGLWTLTLVSGDNLAILVLVAWNDYKRLAVFVADRDIFVYLQSWIY
jgi:hypothetical protein